MTVECLNCQNDRLSAADAGCTSVPGRIALSLHYLRRVVANALTAAGRVHHYRDLHTGMVRHALCVRDCGTGRDCQPD